MRFTLCCAACLATRCRRLRLGRAPAALSLPTSLLCATGLPLLLCTGAWNTFRMSLYVSASGVYIVYAQRKGSHDLMLPATLSRTQLNMSALCNTACCYAHAHAAPTDTACTSDECTLFHALLGSGKVPLCPEPSTRAVDSAAYPGLILQRVASGASCRTATST
jgi:hypothetical protein